MPTFSSRFPVGPSSGKKERLLNIALQAVPLGCRKNRMARLRSDYREAGLGRRSRKTAPPIRHSSTFFLSGSSTSQDFKFGVEEAISTTLPFRASWAIEWARKIISIRSNSHFFQSGFAWAANNRFLRDLVSRCRNRRRWRLLLGWRLVWGIRRNRRRFMLSETRRETICDGQFPFMILLAGALVTCRDDLSSQPRHHGKSPLCRPAPTLGGPEF